MANIPRCDRRVCLFTGSALFLSSLLDTELALAAGPELAVIVHPSNPIQLSIQEIAAIFKTSRRYWSGSNRIVPLNLPTSNNDRALFDRIVLGLDKDAALRFWIDRKIRGGEPPPRSVPQAELVVRIVQQLESAVGYVPRHLVSPHVRTIARVRTNGAETAIGLIARGDT
jgi:ABC-type phosphate transport system substrate-binding protein